MKNFTKKKYIYIDQGKVVLPRKRSEVHHGALAVLELKGALQLLVNSYG